MSGIYKLAGRADLRNMGKFFQRIGANVFRFRPGEMKDFSKLLLANVQKYVPKRTGILSTSLVAQADYNAIMVVARTDIQLSSGYQKEYAEYVEAGVFGKEQSRLVPTPGEHGGPMFVMTPETVVETGEMESVLAWAERSTEFAKATAHGYAQFMRAGLTDTMPTLLRNLRVIIQDKYVRQYKGM